MSHLYHRDRQWDYEEFRRGVRFTAQADGLWPYQRDAVDWLFRTTPAPSTWAPGDPIIRLPDDNGGAPGRLGRLVEQLSDDRWRIRVDDSDAAEDAPTSALWSPRSDYAKTNLHLCLAPGIGKTICVAEYLAQLPRGIRAAVITASGLDSQMEKELNKWLARLGGGTIAAAPSRGR